MDNSAPARLEAFIARWQHASGTERANYQLFLTELTEVLDLPRPEPAREGTEDNAYVFERRVDFRHGDGSESRGFIDLYRRQAFVCEAKQTGETLGSGRWDNAMLRARGQAEAYARALPAAEGRPPFLVVTDVGRSLELYAEFSRSGATYVPFPDVRSHRIGLADLRREDIRERLKAVWLDPLALDPTRRSARVTREVADRLAQLARSLESAKHPSETVAGFLMRSLFTMFAEDVGLLPAESFKALLEECERQPDAFVPLVAGLWQDMNHGSAFSAAIRARVLRFNGGLFREATVLPLDRDQIRLLREAAHADWRHVEPAIFGTLLERALDPTERHALGAHYTPRAYVERLVLPTVIEPLRADWKNAQAAAALLDSQGKHKEAVETVRGFHRSLCQVKVLDPACGSGNFLYVTLEHMKRLEGEVLATLEELGETQGLLQLEGISVDPHQFLGLEVNPRAARIAEAVLWIGYLQWHYRTYGNVTPPEPVLRDFRNIECRDAVLAWERIEYVTDERGVPVSRWDGRTYKPHPVTGEPVPDERAQVPLDRYVHPRKAEWPGADFVVGNPPFIGNKRMRYTLGDGYVEALRGAWSDVPETSDLVMYWWDKAADLVRAGSLRRFGLITTNSLKQVFSRKVLERHLDASDPISIAFAVPDHPWVDAADGADVRIAMTVAGPGGQPGTLATVVAETPIADGELDVALVTRSGEIHADLSIGAGVGRAQALAANAGVCFQGMNLVGKGFRLSAEEVRVLGYDIDKLPEVIKPHFNARDLMQEGEPCWIIDLFGLTADEARDCYPALYNWLLVRVKPERDHNNRASYREKWWMFGEARGKLRRAWKGLSRVILTPETAKHRVFVFEPLPFCPDHTLYAVCSADALMLGLLSSRVSALWALMAGGRMGIGNDPRYNNTRCFSTFPFPDPSPAQQATIRALAEELDAHRKRQQAAHPGLTLTGIYNVLEKLRSGETLSAKDKAIHEQGLVSLLKELHDRLDAAVLEAYGWSDLAPALVGRPGATLPLADKSPEQAAAEEELLTRLVELNARRAAEEARGLVRWLRPDFQSAGAPVQGEMAADGEAAAPAATAPTGLKTPWPKTLPEQVQALRTALAAAAAPLAADTLARHFTGARTPKIAELLETLAALGQARREGAAYAATY